MNTFPIALRSPLFAILAAGALILPICAQAALVTFSFPLEESQEVPPSGASGTGSCEVVLNDASGEVTVDCSFSGLDSDAIAAHIHGPAPVGVNAGVILPLTATASTSGTITGNGILAPADVQNVLDGLTYVNLHTVNVESGALRGQIVGRVSASLPTLSTTFLVAFGALMLVMGALALRRQKRS